MAVIDCPDCDPNGYDDCPYCNHNCEMQIDMVTGEDGTCRKCGKNCKTSDDGMSLVKLED